MNPQSDKTHVVVVDGQRATGSMSEAEAVTEAQKRNKLTEANGNPVPENKQAKVARNLMG